MFRLRVEEGPRAHSGWENSKIYPEIKAKEDVDPWTSRKGHCHENTNICYLPWDAN